MSSIIKKVSLLWDLNPGVLGGRQVPYPLEYQCLTDIEWSLEVTYQTINGTMSKMTALVCRI